MGQALYMYVPTHCNCTIAQHIYSQFRGKKTQYKYKESYVGVSKAHFNKLPKELTILYTYTHRTPSKEVVVRGRRRIENIHLILGTHQSGIVQTDLSPPIDMGGIYISSHRQKCKSKRDVLF